MRRIIMFFTNINRLLYVSALIFALSANINGQTSIYNNFGVGQDGWDYIYTGGWTISGYNVAQQYGVEQAMGFESSSDGVLSDIWLAISYCNPSSLPDTVVVFLCSNPEGLPPDSANIMEKWTITDLYSWSQWNTPIHLKGNGSSLLQEGYSYWLWTIGKETTWAMWCYNVDGSVLCPHTIRREGEDWLSISNETASAFRVDVYENVGITTPKTSLSNNNALSQNYPNPFSSSTVISYHIESPNNVKIIVCDLCGKEVELLVNAFQDAGDHTINFNPDLLPNGIYMYKLLVGNQIIDVKKMSCLKK